MTPNKERYGAAREISRAKNNIMSEQSRRPSPKPKVPDMPAEMLSKCLGGWFWRSDFTGNSTTGACWGGNLREEVEIH